MPTLLEQAEVKRYESLQALGVEVMTSITTRINYIKRELITLEGMIESIEAEYAVKDLDKLESRLAAARQHMKITCINSLS